MPGSFWASSVQFFGSTRSTALNYAGLPCAPTPCLSAPSGPSPSIAPAKILRLVHLVSRLPHPQPVTDADQIVPRSVDLPPVRFGHSAVELSGLHVVEAELLLLGA